MTVWGYARVSTLDQDPQLQIDALLAAGVSKECLFVDRVSGAKKQRPALDVVMSRLRPGDALVVWKLDRLGRTLRHLVETIDELGRRDVEFKSLTEALDTSTPGGKLLFHVMAATAEFERAIIRERTLAGQRRARAAGKLLGRPTPLTPEQVAMARQLRSQGLSQRTIANTIGSSKSAINRLFRGQFAAYPNSDTK